MFGSCYCIIKSNHRDTKHSCRNSYEKNKDANSVCSFCSISMILKTLKHEWKSSKNARWQFDEESISEECIIFMKLLPFVILLLLGFLLFPETLQNVLLWICHFYFISFLAQRQNICYSSNVNKNNLKSSQENKVDHW